MTDIPQASRSPFEHERDAGDDMTARVKAMEPLDLAVMFHNAYEELAPQFGYETRPETRAFDPESKNGRLMVATCARILATLVPDFRAALEQAQAQNRELALQCLAIDGQAGEALDRAARAEADAERLRAQVADLQRSRDRYRAEWDQARAREGALSLACPEEHRAVLTKGTDHD